MNEAKLTIALNLLGEFLAEGVSPLVWLVVGGGSALLQELGHADLIPEFP